MSHNKKQKSWVRELATFLRAQGLEVFLDDDDVIPGEDVVSALEGAVASSKNLLLILSRSSVCSRWVSFEVAMKVFEDIEESVPRLIPVLIEQIDRSLVRLSIRRLDTVDLTDPETREFEFAHLLQALGVSAEKASSFQRWPEPSGIEPLSTEDINSILARGWDGLRLLNELIKLDYEIIDGLTIDHEGQASQWAPVFMDHPDTWRLITNFSRDIVGYWHFVPLFGQEYELAKEGLLLDGQITTDKVRLFEIPGNYDIYFVSAGLLPKYRRTRAMTLLLKSIMEVFLDLASEGIFIRELCSNAYTPSGEAFCKSLGLRYLKPHADHGKIYCVDFKALLAGSIFDECQELRRLYAKRDAQGFTSERE